MALEKQNKKPPIMEFGENRDLTKILSQTKQKDKRIQFIIDENIHTEFKIQCLKNGLDMSGVLKNLIKNWLKKNSK